MSASPGDAQPVFDLICRQARALLDVPAVVLLEYDGALIHLRAEAGLDSVVGAIGRDSYAVQWPRSPDRGSLVGRAILNRAIVHVRNVVADTEICPAIRELGHKSSVTVPMMRGGRAIGAISVPSERVDGISDSQVELLKTFAEQAVIAIGSAETYRALQERTAALAQRNSEFGERIEQQSATIDVLKEMSASPGDPQPVFDLITRRAQMLCHGHSVAVYEMHGGLVHLRAVHGLDTATTAAWTAAFPMAPTRSVTACRAIFDQQTIHYRDIESEPDLNPAVRALGVRSIMAMPLMRDGAAIGSIALNSREPVGFSDSQVELLKTFAEQAVIAIGSAETYRALQERTAALAQRNSEFGERIEQQSATIDVLKVMSRTPDDTQPVFDQIVRRAKELCNSNTAMLFELRDGLVHFGAICSDRDLNTPAYAAYLAQYPMTPTRGSIICRTILDSQIIHIKDIDAETGLSPAVRALIKDGIYKSQVAIPLIRDGQAIGCISLSAAAPGGYTDSQAALLQTFAEQAVIAITSVANFRALRERTEALARSVAELQALEEVLRAVNSSLDLDTVLETIISRAVRLSRSDEGTIYEFDATEQVFVPKSAFGMTEERVALLRDRRIRLGETHLGRSAVLRAPVFTDDVQQDAIRSQRRRGVARHPCGARRAAAARRNRDRRPGDPPAHRGRLSRPPPSR